MTKYLIIIPTYNEKENIERLINSIFKETKCLSVNILIIDDNSPDGTAEIVKKISKKYNNNLFLIKRKKKLGLGSAYLTGFKWGLKNNYDILVEMDADFSHNPIYLPKMIALVKKNDFIVGSRYVKNGEIKNWGILRKFISFGGSLYSRIILGVPIKDLTGGFNVWNKRVLENINLDNIISEGYSFQIELKYRAFQNGFKMFEYPIIFENRFKGKSKMSKKIFFEAIINVLKLKFLKYKNKPL